VVRLLLVGLVWQCLCAGSASGHEVTPSKGDAAAIGEAVLVAVKAEDHLSQSVVERIERLLGGARSSYIDNIANGHAMQGIPASPGLKRLRESARVLQVVRGCGRRLGLNHEFCVRAARGQRDDAQRAMIALLRKLGHKEILPALESLSKSKSDSVLAIAGKVTCALSAHTRDPKVRLWAVTCIRRLVRHSSPQVVSCLPYWIVAVGDHRMLKPLAEALRDNRGVDSDARGVLVPNGGRTVRTCAMAGAQSYFKLHKELFRWPLNSDQPEAVATWYDASWRQRDLYRLKSRYVPSLDYCGTLSKAVKGHVAKEDGWTVEVTDFTVFPDGVGPRATYHVAIHNGDGDLIGSGTHSRVLLGRGSLRTYSGEFGNWVLSLRVLPTDSGDRLAARIRLWRSE
jgi:hypothetical protein